MDEFDKVFKFKIRNQNINMNFANKNSLIIFV